MNADRIQDARSLLEQSLVWDNHTCMPLRPGDHSFLDQLQRAKKVGVKVIALNLGFGPQSLEAHFRMAASFRHWLAQHSDQYSLAKNIQDIDRARSDGKLAVVFDIEGMVHPSLGSLAAPWDFIEVPSLLNERWLLNRTTLKRFARHHETGEPMPDELIDRIERVAQFDRVFSASLNFLGTAIVDMELHLRADSREIDAMAVEQEVLNELQLPQAIDLTLYVQHAFHTFTEQYAAGVYTYLWSDVIAADIAEVFSQAPNGIFDTEVGQKYWTTMLQAANTVPAAEAFRQFRGREEADPAALMRRFDLDRP